MQIIDTNLPPSDYSDAKIENIDQEMAQQAWIKLQEVTKKYGYNELIGPSLVFGIAKDIKSDSISESHFYIGVHPEKSNPAKSKVLVNITLILDEKGTLSVIQLIDEEEGETKHTAHEINSIFGQIATSRELPNEEREQMEKESQAEKENDLTQSALSSVPMQDRPTNAHQQVEQTSAAVEKILEDPYEFKLRQEIAKQLSDNPRRFHADYVSGFHCDRAYVRTKSGCYFFIDRHGKITSDFYNYVENYSEGLAVVGNQIDSSDELEEYEEHNMLYQYIDVNGKRAFPAVFTEAASFSEGLAAVEISEFNPYAEETYNDDDYDYSFTSGAKGDTHFINKKGQIVIEGPFVRAGKFKGGKASVDVCYYPGGEDKEYSHKINKKGEVVDSDYRYLRIDEIIMSVEDEAEGYIPYDNLEWVQFGHGDLIICKVLPSGETVRLMDITFDMISDMYDGLALAQTYDEESGKLKYVFINEDWEITHEGYYYRACNVGHGLVIVSQDNSNFYLVDKNGKRVSDRKFKRSWENGQYCEFKDGLLKVELDGEKVYIDEKFNVVFVGEKL